MSESRTVTVNINAAEKTAMCRATSTPEWERAVGYLSAWNMSFPVVSIYGDGSTDLTAVYYINRHDESVGYVIGAVWNADTQQYGFHS